MIRGPEALEIRADVALMMGRGVEVVLWLIGRGQEGLGVVKDHELGQFRLEPIVPNAVVRRCLLPGRFSPSPDVRRWGSFSWMGVVEAALKGFICSWVGAHFG